MSLVRSMKLIGIVVLIAAGLYFAWSWAFSPGTLRYRLTLEAEADGQSYTGSGVIEVRYDIPPSWLLPGNRVAARHKGEAVVVDLGTRGLLFVVLEGEPIRVSGAYSAKPTSMPVKEFNLAPSVGALKEETVRGLGRLNARAEIPFSRLPLMVAFKDINDPRSVVLVRPDDLSAVFGPGVRLLRTTIETTHDAVTTGIEKRLPWLKHQRGSLIKDPALPYDHFAKRLNGGSFSIGVSGVYEQ